MHDGAYTIYCAYTQTATTGGIDLIDFECPYVEQQSIRRTDGFYTVG